VKKKKGKGREKEKKNERGEAHTRLSICFLLFNPRPCKKDGEGRGRRKNTGRKKGGEEKRGKKGGREGEAQEVAQLGILLSFPPLTSDRGRKGESWEKEKKKRKRKKGCI